MALKFIILKDIVFLHQIEIMKETKCLISIHGAGLTNMLFMPEGGSCVRTTKW